MNYRKQILAVSILAALFIGGTATAAAGATPNSADQPAYNAAVSSGPSASSLAVPVPQQASATETKTNAKSKTKTKPPVTNLQAISVVGQVGTNIKGVAPVGAETITLDRNTILKSGATSVHELLQTIPQISNDAPAGLGNERQGGTAGYGSAFGSANSTQGVSANLRGLGPQATLVLLDGHRVTPTGAGTEYTSINQVPAAALKAVQVLTGGGSAVYGSDAVAGVINLVVRRDFNGFEISPRATWSNGYDSHGVSAIAGHTWSHLGSIGRGNFMMTLDYSHRSAMLESASPYLSDDLTRFGGVNNEIRGGTITTGAINGGVGPGQPGQPGSSTGGTGPVANPGATSNIAWCDDYAAGQCTSGTYLYRALPLGSTVSTYADTSAQPSLSDRADTTDYLPRQKRYQFDVFYNQAINPDLSFSFTGIWTHRKSLSVGSSYTSAIPVVTVGPGSPFYIAPPAPAGGPMTIDLSPAATGLPPWNTLNKDTNWDAIFAIHAKVWGDWHADFSVTYGHDHVCGECQHHQLDVGALQYYVDTGEINPLSTSPLTSTQLSEIVGKNIQWNNISLQDDVLKFNGTVVDLPGGPLKAAFGVEYMRNTEQVINGASRTDAPRFGIHESAAEPPVGFEGIGCTAPLPCPPRTHPNEFAYDNIESRARKSRSGFIEFYVPVVSASQGIPLVRSLVFDVADRYDHYSGIGGRSDPKISFSWALSQDVSIQGTWGTSFVAPNLVQSDPFVFSYKAFVGNFPNLSGDPSISGSIPGLVNVGLIGGNKEDLQPETARTWSLGTTITPRAIPKLRVSATYYHIKYQNLILGVGDFPAGLLSASGLATYRPYIHPVHNPSDCSATNPDYDSALLPYINAVGIYGIVTPAQLCQVNVWVDARGTNVGSMTENGADFRGRYEFRNDSGDWVFNLDATKIISEKLALTPTQPSFSILGSMLNGGLVPWRGRASVTWIKGPVNATIFGNYVGPYRNDNPLFGMPDSDVPSWTTVDFNLSVYLGAISDAVPDWLDSSFVSLHVSNVFDRDPPVVLTAGGASFDGNNANIFGRIISLHFHYKGFF